MSKTKNGDRQYMLTFKAPGRLKKMLDKRAWRDRCSRSEIIRRSCFEYLSTK